MGPILPPRLYIDWRPSSALRLLVFVLRLLTSTPTATCGIGLHRVFFLDLASNILSSLHHDLVATFSCASIRASRRRRSAAGLSYCRRSRHFAISAKHPLKQSQ